MLTYEKVLEIFHSYLDEDDVYEVVITKRGYTVMTWDSNASEWFDVKLCKTPEHLLNALLSGYYDFSEQKLTHNRRNLTEEEIADIKYRCRNYRNACEQ